MPKTATKSLTDYYGELNRAQQTKLREKFSENFDYESPDTFYKKLNGTSPIWNLEKQFFCLEFKVSPQELFPTMKGGKK